MLRRGCSLLANLSLSFEVGQTGLGETVTCRLIKLKAGLPAGVLDRRFERASPPPTDLPTLRLPLPRATFVDSGGMVPPSG
jgi:hypothetical protein